MMFNTSGHDNSAVGYDVLSDNSTGYENTAFGVATLANNTTGSGNTALGMVAGLHVTTGTDNVLIGAYTDGYDAVSNAIVIGAWNSATASNTVRIGNSAITSIGGTVNWSTT